MFLEAVMKTRLKRKALLTALILTVGWAFAAENALDTAIADAAKGLEKALKQGERVAVSRISMNSGSEKLSNYIMGELQFNFVSNQKLLVVDRNNLEDIYRELELNTTKYVDPKQAVVIGKMVGARYFISGAFTNKGDSYELTLSITQTENSALLPGGAFKQVIRKDSPVTRLISDINGGFKVPRNPAEILPDIYGKSLSKADQTFMQASNNLQLGFSRQNPSEVERALSGFTAVIKDNPDYILAYIQRSQAYLALQNHDAALKDINTAVAFYEAAKVENPNVYGLRGQVYYAYAYAFKDDAVKFDASLNFALRDFDRSITINPKHYAAWINKGEVYTNLDNFKDTVNYKAAEKAFQEALKLDKDSAAAYEYLGMLYFNHKNYTSAERMTKEVIRLNEEKQPFDFIILARIYIKQNQYAKARESLEKAETVAKRLDPASQGMIVSQVRLIGWTLDIKQGKPKDALDGLDFFFKFAGEEAMNQQSMDFFLLRAAARLKNNDISGARADYNKFNELTKGWIDRFVYRFLILYEDLFGTDGLALLQRKEATTITVDGKASTSISLSESGASKTVTISTNGASWDIATKPDWVTASKSGNTLTIKANANSGNARNGTVTVKADAKTASVAVTQEAVGRFTISKVEFANVEFDSLKVIDAYNTVLTATKVKAIRARITFSNTASSSTTKSLQLKVYHPNQSGVWHEYNDSVRTEGKESNKTVELGCFGWKTAGNFKSGTYTYEVWCDGERLYRATFTLRGATRLTINSKTAVSASFPATGGTETFSVSTDGDSWRTTSLPSWCSLTNKTPTSFTIRCDANSSTSSRSGSFKVIADEKEVTIAIAQTGKAVVPSAGIESVWVEHNILGYGGNGMRIHTVFTVDNLQGRQGACVVRFFFNEGAPLLDYNFNYRDGAGVVCTTEYFIPNYDGARFSNFVLFIPYVELHLSRGFHNLRAHVEIYDDRGNSLAGKDYFNISVTMF
jgi:tetratricopeptide (TPR) repeat protein